MRASAISKRRRFEAVSKVIQQLPVELHCSEEDLYRLPPAELKVCKQSVTQSLHCSRCLELTSKVLSGGHSQGIGFAAIVLQLTCKGHQACLGHAETVEVVWCQ